MVIDIGIKCLILLVVIFLNSIVSGCQVYACNWCLLDHHPVGIIITDGNAKTADPIPRAQDAINLGINMFAIAINTGELDATKIKPLASDETTNYFEVQDFAALGEITDAVTAATDVCGLDGKYSIFSEWRL